ncbi:hypothetical protein [Paraburkholderia strydomiana]|uniref:hypothetical protein n=1 Tax=Paraburkholderia strydomiana TaxID=1245417 RepID=UPI0038B814DF
MPDHFEIRLTGKLAPGNQVSARTLSHSLLHVQRAVDKMVIFEKRGVLRKYAGLKSEEYAEADLIVQQFQEGSIRIPLINDAYGWLSQKFNELVFDQYQTAAHEIAVVVQPLDKQVPAALNRALHKRQNGNRQSDLIDDQARREAEYLKSAVLQEINGLISPLRSSAITEAETISFTVGHGRRRTNYEFDKRVSKQFNRLVSSKRLGPETLYTGTLAGLGQKRSGRFKFQGQFVSSVTGDEMTLLISREEDATALNDFNLKNQEFSFWASPVTTFGAFDEQRGDIVFLAFPR